MERGTGDHFSVVRVDGDDGRYTIGVLLTSDFARGLGDDLVESTNIAISALGTVLRKASFQLDLENGKSDAFSDVDHEFRGRI